MENQNTKQILVGLVMTGVMLFAASLYVSEKQADSVGQIKLLAAEQETTLATLAQIIDQDGADAVVAKLIVDCNPEDRERFDTLLSKLDTLNLPELYEVDDLFSACGDYFAQRRAVMVARLIREFEVYNEYVTLLKITNPREAVTSYSVDQWSRLVEMEEERSKLSKDLVAIQGDIITDLIAGMRPGAPELQSKLIEATQKRQTIALLAVEIDVIREDLIGL